MVLTATHRQNHRAHTDESGTRLRVAAVLLILAGVAIIVRLFVLMVLEHKVYAALAAGTQESTAKLFPRRGEIFGSDARTGVEYPLAINKDVFLLYADTREIKDDAAASSTAGLLTDIFHYDDTRRAEVYAQLNKRTDPYEPIEMKVEPVVADDLKTKKIAGLHFIRQDDRFYPEHELAATTLGFVGKNAAGSVFGQYGIEGYWQQELAGTGGIIEGVRGADGSWIASASRLFKPAQDGATFVLTLDRTLQYRACERLRVGLKEYGATSASLMIMEPHTGAILAMCSLPDFDVNAYGKVTSAEVYNNSTIFTPYEPGSIFKPIGMVAALNENVVTPDSPFHDTGRRDGLCQQPIQNAANKIHGDQTMTGIMQNSINTGMVYVVEHLGKARFVDYVRRLGFGVKTGLELDTETSGTIDSLSLHKNDKLDCYTATAAFGQGITATPLQIVTAFSAIANGGTLMKPYIVKEIRYADGRIERTKPHALESVLSPRATQLLGGMLVKTVDKGYSGRARVPGYYVAGKSGTAEIAGAGGYTKTYNHSFIGYAPVDDPRYVMLVKYEKPERAYAESTAAPVFGELSKFILEYFQVAPSRTVSGGDTR